MKRYSVSIAYTRNRDTGKVCFHYWGRTDDIEETISNYKGDLQNWISRITDEKYEYREQTNDYRGIKITDSQTKKVVYEDYHVAEEYGYKKIIKTNKWVKL